jgi:prepilin-type N-terminal cleavage/methylation domain-containing protein
MSRNGFTLIEVMFAVALAALAGIFVVSFAKNVLGLNQSASQSLTAELEGGRSIKRMVAEIREAGQSATGSYAMESAGTSSLAFYADIDSNGTADRVRYFLDPATRSLKRGIVVPSGNPLTYNLSTEAFSTLASDIKSTSTPIFDYYDKNYAGTSSPLSQPVNVDLVRLVRITFYIDKDPNRSPTPMAITSLVNLRNLKDNQ